MAKQVTVEGHPVSTNILSTGNAPSEGMFIIDGDESFYIPDTSSDTEDLIDSMDAAFDKLITVLQGLDAVTQPPGTQTAAILQLKLLFDEISMMKDNLQ